MKLLLAVLLVAGTSAYGSTLVVNNNGANTSSPCKTASFSTISSAVTAASAGDTVEVCPGTYPEAVYINKANLKLTGLTVNGSSLVELRPTAGITTTDVNPSAENPNENVILLVDSVSGVAITGISVSGSQATTTCGSGNAGIYFRNASGSVTNSAVSYIGLNSDGTVTGCQEGIGVYVDSHGGTASLTITGSSVHDYDKAGIVADESGTTLVATGNTVTGAGPTTATAQNGIEVDDGAKGTVNNNVISANDYTPNSSAGTSILFYQSASGGQANDNIISETNNGIFFYQANSGTANGNNISKVYNYDGIATFQSNSDTIEKNTITRSGLEVPENGAIYICGSKTKVESNNLNEAPFGVYDDRTSADGCSGASGNTTSLNLYHNVGDDAVIVTNSPSPLLARANRTEQSMVPKVSPTR